MVIEITGVPTSETNADLEQLVTRVFFRAIDLLGGLLSSELLHGYPAWQGQPMWWF
jgi:hypothetical protein